jgi:hypothetical protein
MNTYTTRPTTVNIFGTAVIDFNNVRQSADPLNKLRSKDVRQDKLHAIPFDILVNVTEIDLFVEDGLDFDTNC